MSRHEKRAADLVDARKRKALNDATETRAGPDAPILEASPWAECPEKWVGGTSMGNKERLKGILERQAAAAERERLDEEAASAKAEKVRSVRVEVIQKWQEQRAHLETYIAQINKETSKNDVQLFVVKNPRHADTGVGMEVDKMEVAFRQRTPHDKKLVISVRANGEAYVSISTSSVSQAQQYTLNVLEVTNEQLEATVLDFLDANTPK